MAEKNKIKTKVDGSNFNLENETVVIVLMSGEKMKCTVLKQSNYELKVQTKDYILIVPKHSINYYILEKVTEEKVKEEK